MIVRDVGQGVRPGTEYRVQRCSREQEAKLDGSTYQ